jgi:AGCS family alanine or glycine:cation symporter
MAILFAVLITCQFGLSNNSIQANTICGAMQEAFGWSPLWVGIFLALTALYIVFGGIQRIAHVSAFLVPVMAIGYLILALVIIIMNYDLIPHVLKVIVTNAFGFEQVAGGGLGATIMYGVKRGLFSNEAGEGSAPNVAATAAVSHPVKQGLIQALGVFTDTLVVCSCTAFIILISGLYQVPELNGIAITQSSLQSEIGSAGPIFIAIAIFLFAFSSIIGNYYYGEANIRFITPNPTVMTIYRICSAGLMVIFGALSSFELVWNIVDFFMAFLTACNLVAIVLLGRYAFRLLDDYRQQKRKGIKEPVFHRRQFPEIEDELECWE